MASAREKISSIYIVKAEQHVAAALDSFKEEKDKLGLSHSDLYKTGLALYSAHPDLVQMSKLMLSTGKPNVAQVSSYFSAVLGTQVNVQAPTAVQASANVDLEPLLEQITNQSAKIDDLSKIIQEQSELIAKMQMGTSEPEEETKPSDKPAPKSKLDAYDENGNAVTSGVVKESGHLRSQSAMIKSKRAALKNI